MNTNPVKRTQMKLKDLTPVKRINEAVKPVDSKHQHIREDLYKISDGISGFGHFVKDVSDNDLKKQFEQLKKQFNILWKYMDKNYNWD